MPERLLDRRVRVSIVIPCYNEEAVLPLLHERLSAATCVWPVDYQVILVDDGSNDATWEIMRRLHAGDSRWRAVRLARNFGHQLALWTGLQHADGDLVAVLDADLQDPPEILPRFFDMWKQGYDVIYGVRRKRKEHVVKRAAYSSFYRLLNLLSEVSIPLDSGDFCVMDRRVVHAMLQTQEREPFVRGLRAWVGFRQTALEYERDARAAGEVKYTLPKLFRLAANGIVSFSTRPLRLASYLGMGVSACSLLGAVAILFQTIFGGRFASDPLPAYVALVTAMMFVGGVQLLCMGILGEYIGRIYANSKGRPQAIVASTEGIEKPFSAPSHRSAA